MTAIHNTQNPTAGRTEAVIRKAAMSVLSVAAVAFLIVAAGLAVGATHPTHVLAGLLHLTLSSYFGVLIGSIAAIAAISEFTSAGSREKTQFDIR